MTDGGLTVRVSGELRANVANSMLVLRITNNTQYKNLEGYVRSLALRVSGCFQATSYKPD